MVLDSKRLRTMGFLAALVVFALGVALLLRRDAGEGAEFASGASAPEEATVSPGTGLTNEETTELNSARAALDADETKLNGATETPPEPGIELLAVVGVHRRRVAPVEMWWWEPKDPENWQELGQLERWLQSGEVDARLAELARKLEPDETGAFHAPTPDATGCVAARADGLWGWTRVQRSSPDPTYVQLESDETLRVRVLDASGAAAPGVRVALRQRWALSGDEEFGDTEDIEYSVECALVLTDADGTALVPHYRSLMKEHWDFDARSILSVAEPFAEPIEVEIDPTLPPRDVVEFQLPPSGSVVLEVSGHTRGGLFSLRTRDATTSTRADASDRSEGFLRAAGEGVVRFPWVGLGMWLTPTSRVAGEARTHDESAAPGPARAGEERRLRIDLAEREERGLRLSGTLVGPAIRSIGMTRVDVALEAEAPDGGPWKHFSRVVVAPDGRFQLALPQEVRGRASLEFTVRGPRDERVGVATASVIGQPGATELEIGEVFLDTLPLLVSGRVVDARGRRAVGADVTAWGRRADGGNGWNGGWERSPHLRTFTGFSGDFEVRGSGDWTALGLAAWTADGASEFQIVELGATGVVLTLGSDGGIAGSVRPDSGLAREYLTVNVRREGPNASPHGSTPYRRSEIDSEGAFVLRGLAPGSYTVSIAAAGTPETVATVGGVLVEAGRMTRDPRLDGLDLGHWSELRVLASDGTLAIDANVYLIERATSRWTRQRLGGGKLVYEHGTAPLWVLARRHLPASFDPASRATSLQLERAPLVQIVVPEDLAAALSSANFLLTFHSTALPPSVARLHPNNIEVRGPRSEPFQLLFPSPLSSTLFVSRDSTAELPHTLSGSVSTSSRAAVQTLELRWKPEDLALSLERSER